jgi:serine protease Do
MKNFAAALLLASAMPVLAASGPASTVITINNVHPMAAHNSQGYLGVDIRDVTDDQVAALKLKEAGGAEIVMLDHDGPASKAGLKEHDVVLQMNGQAIEGEEQLRRMLHETPAGRTIALSISRDGQPQTISVQLGNRAEVERQAWDSHFTIPEPPTPPLFMQKGFMGSGAVATVPPVSPDAPIIISRSFVSLRTSDTGALVENLTPQLADFFGAKKGVLIASVDEKSPAATAGLKAGDVITKANATEIATPSDWIRTVRENRGKPVTLTVLRNKQEQTITITPADSKDKKHSELEQFNLDLPDTQAMVAEMKPEMSALADAVRQQALDMSGEMQDNAELRARPTST